MKSLIILVALAFFNPAFASTLQELGEQNGTFTLPSLPYAEKDLASVIDAETMKIHHGKHHQAYVDNLNKELKGQAPSLKKLLTQISKHSDAVRNNAGGHWNHSFFWTVMTPKTEDQKLPEDLKVEIEKTFGTFEKFQEEFEEKGAAQFGSGWVWLIRNKKGKLEITSTPNQDNPLMDVAKVKGTPIFGADVWEHAYYLKYQNKRAEYLKAFWQIVNWKQVSEYNEEAQPRKK